MSRPEDNLQRQVASYLEIVKPDCAWTHFPAGEARTAVTGAKLRRFGLKRGWPDMIFVLPGGRFAAVELKAPTGRQSPDQKAVQASIEQLGGFYVVCRSLADVEAALKSWGVTTRGAGRIETARAA